MERNGLCVHHRFGAMRLPFPRSHKWPAAPANQNHGPSCIAAKRFIVVDQITDEFEHGWPPARG